MMSRSMQERSMLLFLLGPSFPDVILASQSLYEQHPCSC
jgi:hypothetical protein